RANASSAYLRAGAALLASLDEVPPARFRRFVSELRLDADYRGAEGIGWAPVVYPDQVEAFDAMLAEIAPGRARLHPRPDGSRPYAVPVAVLEPDTERNRRALGFDMFSEAQRREAMVDAERTARPTASGRVTLIQEGEGSAPGFVIYMPVFEPVPEGPRLRGSSYSPFTAIDFLAAALEQQDTFGYDVALYDGASSIDDNLLARVEGGGGDGETVTERVPVGADPWTVTVTASSTRGLSGLSMATIVFGI